MNKYVYICWGYEVGTVKGTPHLQGYIELKSGRSIKSVRKDAGLGRCKLFPRNGTKLQAVTYCAKEFCRRLLHEILLKEHAEANDKSDPPEIPSDKAVKDWSRSKSGIKVWRKRIYDEHQTFFFEAGDWDHGLHPGTRSDINVVKEVVKSGGNILDVIDHANSYQALRMGQIMLTEREATRTWQTQVYWVWGDSGAGKTAFCFKHAIGRVWKITILFSGMTVITVRKP